MVDFIHVCYKSDQKCIVQNFNHKMTILCGVWNIILWFILRPLSLFIIFFIFFLDLKKKEYEQQHKQ